MWYDETFKELTEARAARFCDPMQKSVVMKHKARAPLAPTLGYNAEKLRASGHHRRTSSLERHENSPTNVDDHKNDVMNTLGLDIGVAVAAQKAITEKENFVETGPIAKKEDSHFLAKKPGNQRQFSGESGSHGQCHKNPDSKKLHAKRNVAESQRSTSDPKSDTTNSSRKTNSETYDCGGKSVKQKKKGNNNKRRESGLRDETRIASSSAEFPDARASRSILEQDHSIVSYTLNGEKLDSPDRSPEISIAGPLIQPPRGSRDDCRNASNSTTGGFRPEMGPQFSSSMHPYGQPPFGEQPWHQVPMDPPPDFSETPNMIPPSIEMFTGDNPYLQWSSMMPPVQSYGHMTDTPFHALMHQNSGPSYHSQFDTVVGGFPPHNQTFQPYQSETQYGRKGNRKRYPDEMRYTGDRSSYRRWNFPRGHPRGASQVAGSGFAGTTNESAYKMSLTYGTAPQQEPTDNSSNAIVYSPMDSANYQTNHAYQERPGETYMTNNSILLPTEALSSLTTGIRTESITVETTLQVDEKANETVTDGPSAPTIKYPMVYTKVGSPANTQSLAGETAHSSTQQHSEDKGIDTTPHKDRVQTIHIQALASTLTQKVTSETPTTSVQNDNRNPTVQEQELGASIMSRSSSGPSQPAKALTTWRSSSSNLSQETHPSDRSSREDPLKLYVSGVHLTNRILLKAFERYRAIDISPTYPRKPWNTDNGNFKSDVRYAFVAFGEVNDCNAARRALSGAICEDVKLRIHPAFMKRPLEPSIDEGLSLDAAPANQRSEVRIPGNTNPNRKESPQTHSRKVSDRTSTEHQASINTTSEKVYSLKSNPQKGNTKANTKPKKTSRNVPLSVIPGEQAAAVSQIISQTSAQPEIKANKPVSTLLIEPKEEYQQANGAKSEQAGDLTKNLEAVGTGRPAIHSDNNDESEHSQSPTGDSNLESTMAADHPPVQGRLKKNKTKQKKKARPQSKDAIIHDGPGATSDPASPHSSLNSQSHSFAASIEDSFNSQSIKDEPGIEKTAQRNSPSGLSRSAQTFVTTIPEPSQDITVITAEGNGSGIEHSTPAENDIKSGSEKHGPIVPPNSPIDIVMIDLSEERETESLPDNVTRASPQENEHIDYVSSMMASNATPQIISGDEQNLQQISTISDRSRDSDHSRQSACVPSSNDDGGNLILGKLLDNGMGVERIVGQHRELHYSFPSIATDRGLHVPVARSEASQHLGIFSFDLNGSLLTDNCLTDPTSDTKESPLEGSIEQLLSICPQLEPPITNKGIRVDNQANPKVTREDAGIGSSTFGKTTDDKTAQKDDYTQGWDKSVKVNAKNSRKKHNKARKHSGQSVKTSIEMIHDGRANTGEEKVSANQHQSAAKDSRSPESVKSNKFA